MNAIKDMLTGKTASENTNKTENRADNQFTSTTAGMRGGSSSISTGASAQQESASEREANAQDADKAQKRMSRGKKDGGNDDGLLGMS